jgi:serine/threonine protein kinase
VLGTPAYMSPEQMRSAATVDARTDMWSLGAVLYEIVEGHQPFQAQTYAEMCVLVTTESPPAMTAAPELTPIIEKCLAKEPAERYQTIAELANALAPMTRDPVAARARVPRMYRLTGKQAPFVSHELAAVTPPPEPVAERVVPAPRAQGGSRVMTIAIVLLLALAVGLAIAFNTGLLE